MIDAEETDAQAEPLPLDQASAESEADVETPSAAPARLSSTDWTIETILSQMRKGRIDLNPKFQRRAAWTDATKSRFIESAILGYPIPQVVLAERLDQPGHFFVIDGKQRLLALRQFYAGQGDSADSGFEPLHLTGLTILTDLKGWDIQRLQSERSGLFDAFENHTIRTVVVRSWESESFLYTLFLRLNTGSVPLSPQELRQALVPGPFVDWVDEASGQSAGLRILLANRGPDRRMVDAELLVRFMGFALCPVRYRGNLKAFLDDTCKILNKEWPTRETEIRGKLDEMESAIRSSIEVFGEEHACHKYSGTHWERSFNRAVFDIVIGAFSIARVRRASKSHARRAKILNVFMTLCTEDQAFSEALSTTTKSLEATRERFTKWYGKLSEATGGEIQLPKCLSTSSPG